MSLASEHPVLDRVDVVDAAAEHPAVRYTLRCSVENMSMVADEAYDVVFALWLLEPGWGDRRYFRPTEVTNLLGDASKARERLGWEPIVAFPELVSMMVWSDVAEVQRDELPANGASCDTKRGVGSDVPCLESPWMCEPCDGPMWPPPFSAGPFRRPRAHAGLGSVRPWGGLEARVRLRRKHRHIERSVRLITQVEKCHVSRDAVEEFESAVLPDERVRPARLLSARALGKLLRSMPALPGICGGVFSQLNCDYFLIMMGLQESRCLPYFTLPGRKSIYLFDAWPNRYDRIREFITRWQVQEAFVSSSQAANALSGLIPLCRLSWVAEGIDPGLYRHRPYAARDIDVIQLGRKHDAYHERVLAPLLARRKCYKYESIKGEIIFPTREQFIDGLARSKVSVCFPSSLTHPERSGDTETMTQRYLQSMVSKCLVIGHAPKEMVSLFGYDPVVEADMDNPVEQLLSVLDNFHAFIPLIEMNYRSVVEDHTWTKRWQAIASTLFPDVPTSWTAATSPKVQRG